MSGDDRLAGEVSGIRVDVDRWRQQIPADAWPEGLPGTGELWRRDVFGVADGWRAGRVSARAMLTVACMWGYGMRGYGPARTLAALDDDHDGAKLGYNLSVLREQDPAEGDLAAAYERFSRASRTRLYRLGPAFFTKLLYFAGYRRGAGGVQPLILDSRVAGNLPPDAGGAGRRSWGWPAADWICFLRWAVVQARRPGFGGEADAVEMALFTGRWEPSPPPAPASSGR
jgi:hypothetical protein